MKYLLNNITVPFDASDKDIERTISNKTSFDSNDVEFLIYKKSIDCRGAKPLYTFSFLFESDKMLVGNNISSYEDVEELTYEEINTDIRPIIIGFGPAGMFSALVLARNGIKPIIIERGKKVEDRVKDIQNFNNNNHFDTNSNICYGEGGAGTFSDGKLATGIKDKKIRFVLNEFYEHGADENILYEAGPHIGSDKLIQIVKNMREEIISLGGEFHFSSFVEDITENKNEVTLKIKNLLNDEYFNLSSKYVILAIGHSARETYIMLNNIVKLEPKPFSLGLRIEHLQSHINKNAYGSFSLNTELPSASYKCVSKSKIGRAMYTFCMCPGGVVVASNTEENSIVTNGMSYSTRDGVNGNAAILVNVDVEDYYKNSPLDGLYYRESFEKAGFNKEMPYAAPVQLVKDFLANKVSTEFGEVKPTYKNGTYFADFNKILPTYVSATMKECLPLFSKKLPFFANGDAVLTGIETRSSSPIRITRNENYEASLKGLYPCGEGSGYSGGITSSAIDGINVALNIIESIKNN